MTLLGELDATIVFFFLAKKVVTEGSVDLLERVLGGIGDGDLNR